MSAKKAPQQIMPLIRGSIDTLVNNPVVLIPFLTVAFIHLAVLELLYFAPRFPLSAFFNPVVATLWGERFIHYPEHFMIIPKLFQNTQIVLYIFVSSYFIAVAIALIAALNNNQKMNFRSACRDAGERYIHVFAAALLSFCVFLGLYLLYNLLINNVLKFSSIDGVFFTIKKIVMVGAPYVNVLFGVFVTALFAFVYPVIIIENQKVLAALRLNFKRLWGCFWFIFFVVLVPTLLYVPVVLLRNNIGGIAQATI